MNVQSVTNQAEQRLGHIGYPAIVRSALPSLAFKLPFNAYLSTHSTSAVNHEASISLYAQRSHPKAMKQYQKISIYPSCPHSHYPRRLPSTISPSEHDHLIHRHPTQLPLYFPSSQDPHSIALFLGRPTGLFSPPRPSASFAFFFLLGVASAAGTPNWPISSPPPVPLVGVASGVNVAAAPEWPPLFLPAAAFQTSSAAFGMGRP